MARTPAPEVMSLGPNCIGGEHLLLAPVAEPDRTAGQLLRSLGAQPPVTRPAVAAALAGYGHRTSADLQPLASRIERPQEQAGLGAAT